MSPEVVYRSNHPDVLAHRDKHPALFKEWRSKVEETLVGLGFPVDSDIVLNGQAFTGVVIEPGAPLPDGWRRNRDHREWIHPTKRTAAGRKIAARLEALPQPDPRQGLPGGMPSRCFAAKGMAFMHCGVAELGGCVVVTWSDELEKPSADRIDPEVWERIPLSQYWAMREAAEAEGGAA